MPDTYFIKVKDDERGPYTMVQIKSMWQQGLITCDASYRIATADHWLPLLTVFGPSHPPPPPAITVKAPRIPPTLTSSPQRLRSPWHRAQKPAFAVLSFASMVSILAAGKATASLGFFERCFFTLFLSVVFGLTCAVPTYLIAALFFSIRKQQPLGDGSALTRKDDHLNPVLIAGIIVAILFSILVFVHVLSSSN